MFRYTYPILALLLLGCQQNPDPGISQEELTDHIQYLASEELAGRYPGTVGDSLAASYIRDAFDQYGLELLGDDGYQYIDIVIEVEIGPNNLLMSGRRAFDISTDFIPLSFSGNGAIETELVFAGYGLVIDHSDFSYDAYKELDVTDKVVMVLEGGPHVEEGQKDYFSGYISQRNKILTAKDRGAAAVIFVAGPQFDEADELSFVKKKEPPVGIPVIRVKREVADEFLESNKKTVESLEKSFSMGLGTSFSVGRVITMESEILSKEAHTHNVVALLNGNDLENKPIIVLGAHYDHLGMGGVGSSSRVPDTTAVHYGADDNASGVAVILEIAGALAEKKTELESAVLFIAFAGEEMGLVGSKYFVENPLIDMDQIKAMINLDMVGRLGEARKISVGGTGTAMEFDQLLENQVGDDFEMAKSPEGYGPSDHAAFYSADLPVLYLSTGAHIDYHTPADEPGKINYAGMVEIGELISDITYNLASSMELTYQEAGPKQQAAARTKFKVTLGIMPDVTSNSNDGLGVEFATEGRPAQRAGIQKGDKIVSMNGLPVTNVYDYMTRLRTLEEGQTVVVEVVRNREKLVLLVQL